MEKIPTDFKRALSATPALKKLWDGLTPISQRDFVTWIESAKQEKTRERRIQVALSKLKAGKRRPCCYAVVPMGLYKTLATLPKAKAQWKILSADEKRDFSDWVNAAKDKEMEKDRIEKVCVALSAGKCRR